MTITPVGPNPAQAGAGVGTSTQMTAGGGSEAISIKFAPAGEQAGPLDRVGQSVISKLKNFESSRASRTQAMVGMQAGPANPVDIAKAELLAGPASKSLSAQTGSGMAPAGESDKALSAMTRTFDYAIETQLIVKTGSQLSTSASSLMRGQ